MSHVIPKREQRITCEMAISHQLRFFGPSNYNVRTASKDAVERYRGFRGE